MARAKRDHVVHLTAVKKKSRAAKDAIIEKVRNYAQRYVYAHVVRVHNSRVVHLQALRRALPGRLVAAKLRLMKRALGETPDDELRPGMSKLAERLTGRDGYGIIFTDLPSDELATLLSKHAQKEFARAGAVAKETVVLKEGELTMFSHTQEPLLRQLGLPTKLSDGKIFLLGDTTVCTAGEGLSVEAAQLLRLLNRKMATFSVEVLASWTSPPVNS